MQELTIHAQEELAAGGLLVIFFVWTVVTLVTGLATNRHKNHHVRLAAKARRRLARRTSIA